MAAASAISKTKPDAVAAAKEAFTDWMDGSQLGIDVPEIDWSFLGNPMRVVRAATRF